MTQDTNNTPKNPEIGTSFPRPPIFGKWALCAIAGVAVLLVIILIVMTIGTAPNQGPAIPLSACAEKTINYVNANMVGPGSSINLTSVSEERGVYVIKSQYKGQAITFYTTRDCSLLFTNVINMSITSGSAGKAQQQAPVKSARPVVDLYMMAFCPYGVQAEQAMIPVENLLGKKADIRIHFITTVSGTTVESVSSLHGPEEAKEDLRQICIQRYDPGLYWKYLTAFDRECFPLWQNSSALNACRNNITATLGLTTPAIQTCASGPDGITLLKSDETDAKKKGATASPTLFVNGVKYSGARTPDAYKQAICNSFESIPAECNTTLLSSQASTSGGCG